MGGRLGTGAVLATLDGRLAALLTASTLKPLLLSHTPPSAADWLEKPTAQDYARAAHWAFEAKKLRFALEQMAGALALDPHSAALQRQLDNILASTKAPLEVLALSNGAFFGLCAVRGWALARLGMIDDAVDHVFRAAAFDGSPGYLRWIVRWTKSKRDRDRLLTSTLCRGIASLVARTDANERSIDKSDLESAMLVLRTVSAERPSDESLPVAGSKLLRLLDGPSAALAWIARQAPPASWAAAVEAAEAAQENGDERARLEWSQRATVLRPEDAPTRLRLARALLANGCVSQAADEFERARSSSEPIPDDMRALGLYARALADRTEDSKLSATSPFAQLLQRDLLAYRAHFPDPTDPLIGVIRDLIKRVGSHDEPSKVHIRGERPICPSALATWRLSLPGVGSPAIDASSGLRSMEYGELASRVPGALSGELVRVVQAWTIRLERPQDLVASAFPARIGEEELVDLVLSPSIPPPGEDAIRWVLRWQLACCWHATDGALDALLRAPDDWASISALVTHVKRASLDPARLPRLRAEFRRMSNANDESLAPSARTVAILGDSIVSADAERTPFLALRWRVLEDLHQRTRERLTDA